jgi:L-cysteine:1D-myo-inositol 2-amino-2-deoxy-alpha-D-glucopyranoside ligase
MKLYNGLTQSLQTFEPRGDTIKLYVCGITPYDTTHLGHAFTYTINDILIRFLELRGHTVEYVQNVTDIDDDILRKARELGEDWQTLGNYWTRFFIEDMQSLNVRPPDHYPRATEFIPQIITINEKLVENGIAYVNEGNVYYAVDAWPEFGKLSRLPRPEMLPVANERGNHPDDPNKRHPLDFVLWQAQAAGEPAWESPWGPGRPGWHIECSAMSSTLLGNTLDLHSGGADLMFPHHDCEIAQIEPVTGERPFVRFWMHAAMVYHQGEKMSKSLGNLVMCRNLLKEVSPDALRLYLASQHYRRPWSFNTEDLQRAAELAEMMRQAVSARSGHGGPAFDATVANQRFTAAMEEDLNTPLAADSLVQLGRELLAASAAGQDIRHAQAELRRLASIFGLRLDEAAPEARVITGWQAHQKRFPA